MNPSLISAAQQQLVEELRTAMAALPPQPERMPFEQFHALLDAAGRVAGAFPTLPSWARHAAVVIAWSDLAGHGCPVVEIRFRVGDPSWGCTWVTHLCTAACADDASDMNLHLAGCRTLGVPATTAQIDERLAGATVVALPEAVAAPIAAALGLTLA